MIAISQVADKIGEHICVQAGLESEIQKVCFGIEVIMVMAVSIIITIIMGALLGIFSETLIVITNALLVKFIIGSPHLSGYFRCLAYSVLIILAGAWLCSIYPVWLMPNIALILMLFTLMTLIFMPLLPSYRTFERRQVIARKSLVSVMIIAVGTLFIYVPHLLYAGAMVGISISTLNTSPVGVYFTKWLDRITKRGGAVQ